MTTITQERQKLAGIRPLITREQWGSTFDYSDARTVIEPAQHVFVHITITNPDSYSSDYAHARAVEAIGKSRFPSTGISYNRLHFQSGRAMEGQPIGRRGAHTVNDLQRASCVTSGCPSRGADLGGQVNLNYNARAYVICQNVGHTVTDAELHALAKSIAADKVAGFVLRDAPIHGHRCVSSKSCPGDLMWARMGELEQLVDHYIAIFTQEDDVALTPAQEAAIAKAGWLADQFAQGAQFEEDFDRIQADLQEVLTTLATIGQADVALTDVQVQQLGRASWLADQFAQGAQFEVDLNRIQDALTALTEKVDSLIAAHQPPPAPADLPKA